MERSHMIKIVLACILALVGIAVIVMTVKQYKKGSGFEEDQGFAVSDFGLGKDQQQDEYEGYTSSSFVNPQRKVVGTDHWNAYPQYTVDDRY